MFKKIFIAMVAFVGISLIIFIGIGCGGSSSTTTNPNMSTTPATPPASTSAVKMTGGSITASGNSLNFDFLTLDQNNVPLTNLTLGNISGTVYDSNPSGTSAQVVSQAVFATVTFDEFSSGINTGKPIAVALTLDKSGSMGFDDLTYTKVTTLELAASKFVDLMSSNSMAAVIIFDDHVSVEASMTSDKALLKDRIAIRAGFGGTTAVYDAMSKALKEVEMVNSTNYVRAVLAMTDGMDNSSTSTEAQITAEAIANGIPIYTIGLFQDASQESYYSPPLIRIATATTGTSEGYFGIIAGVTGLSAQGITALGTLTDLYSKLVTALSQAYSARCSLSAPLVAGHQYWLKLNIANYGGYDTSVIIPFIAQ